MDSAPTKLKPLNFDQLLLKIFNTLKRTWAELILIIFIIFCLVFAAIIILYSLNYIIIHYNILNENNFFILRLIWNIAMYLVFFIISIIAQTLVINKLLNSHLSFSANLKSLKVYFFNFFIMMIILNIIFLVASLPIYVAAFLFAFNNIILGVISLFLGFVLTVLAVSYLILSPFTLIDKKLSYKKAISESIYLAQKNPHNIILKIIILVLLIVLLNSFALILTSVFMFGLILSSLIFLFMIIFAFIYLFVLYQDFQAIKND